MTSHIPLIGAPNVVDMPARAENKKLRDVAARGLQKNRALIARVELLGVTLHEAVELLKEARDLIAADPRGAALAARISERVGD